MRVCASQGLVFCIVIMSFCAAALATAEAGPEGEGWLEVPARRAPLGRPGTAAVYELEADPTDRPAFERENLLTVVAAEIRLGAAFRQKGGKPFQWYGLAWTRLNGERYEMWALVDGWPEAASDPGVAHYLWREPGWTEPLCFVHEVTGGPLLPRICLWTHGWPQDPDTGGASNRAPVQGTPEHILLQGWPFNRVSEGKSPEVPAPPQAAVVKLNPDLLIGWISQDRDEDGQPHYRMSSGAYAYVPKTPEDLVAHARAGCNFFVSHPKRPVPEWLARSDLYHNNLVNRPEDWPADLYRPNYWGHANHVDEPGVHNWGLSRDDDPGAPPPLDQAVASLQRIVRKGVEERGGAAINGLIDRNFGRGDLLIEEGEDAIVTWEYEWPTAWYQLAVENGVGGIVDEDAFLDDLVESYNMAFGTEILPTVENACAIRVAVLRGAARNFNKRWGVAFYHPNEVKLKSASVPLLYEMGASRFWFWTGWVGITDNSGLPYPYQRYYASLARQAFAKNPQRDMNALLRAARVAVVIPSGYTFAPHHMHRIPWLHLELRNEHGVPYRDVLSNAAHEAERLLRNGVAFDIAVDEPQFTKEGYDELVYVQADGRIRVERPGQPNEILDSPRPFSRPDLGPRPELRIETGENESGKIRLRAVATIGTGEWAGETPEPRVRWEIYDPDGTVSPAVFPEHGLERTLRLDDDFRYAGQHPVPAHLLERDKGVSQTAGEYVVRAAVADVFGRPAVAYLVIKVAAAE